MIKLFKSISATLLICTAFMLNTNFQAQATTIEDNTSNYEYLSEQFNIPIEDVEFLSDSSNIKNSMEDLNNISYQSLGLDTKIRSINLTDNLILEEELTTTTIERNFSNSRTLRQVVSKMSIKNYLGEVVANLTAIGYFNYNGSVCFATDADYAVSSGAFFDSTGYVSYVGRAPITGYARVSCKYTVKGEIYGHTISTLNVLANLFCNQNGDYYSQWF